jgi:hypothetical protein
MMINITLKAPIVKNSTILKVSFLNEYLPPFESAFYNRQPYCFYYRKFLTGFRKSYYNAYWGSINEIVLDVKYFSNGTFDAGNSLFAEKSDGTLRINNSVYFNWTKELSEKRYEYTLYSYKYANVTFLRPEYEAKVEPIYNET